MIQTQRIFITFYAVMYYIIIYVMGYFCGNCPIYMYMHVHACTYTYGAEKTWQCSNVIVDTNLMHLNLKSD